MAKLYRVICLFFLVVTCSQSGFSTLTTTTDYQSFKCEHYVDYGLPGLADQYLCRDGYAVGYSYKYKQPLWVAYELTGKSVGNKIKRKDKFDADDQIPAAYRAELSDYSKSGYDRGHMAPYASMDFNKESADQSFLLSNMSPQKGGLNRQGWAQLEKYVRFWAKSKEEIWVYTGPIFKGKNQKTIGKNKIAVPSAFYKIIYAPKQNELIAFAMPNERIRKNQVQKYIVQVSQIEQRTGLKFLTMLPAEKRNKLINGTEKMWRTSYK
jgi:endonuclease G